MLHDPKIWQAYRSGFYFFLAPIVMLGATLTKLAAANYAAVLALVVLDLGTAIALPGSSFSSGSDVKSLVAIA